MKFKVGDKVKIPKTKSFGSKIEDSNIIEKVLKENLNCLFVTKIDSDCYSIATAYNKDVIDGDWFAKDDLELYIKPETLESIITEIKQEIYNR